MAKNSLCQIDRILGPNVLRIRIRLSFGILYCAYIQETLQLKPNWNHNRISSRGTKTDPDCFDHRKIRENLWSNLSHLIHFSVFYHHVITINQDFQQDFVNGLFSLVHLI